MKTFTEILLIFILTLGAITIIFGLRNELVYRFRMRAIDLHFNRPYEEWSGIKFDVAYGTYMSMLFDMRKWTFKQFFPMFGGDNGQTKNR